MNSVLTDNLKLKSLSLLFAAVLWLFVALEIKDEMEIPLQVKFINLPPGLSLQGPVGSRPSLRLAGARILLIKQRLTGVTAALDLTGMPAGRVSFASLEKHIRLQEGVTLRGLSPAVVELVLIREGKTE